MPQLEVNMLNVALSYAAQGWPVFPCRATSETITNRDGKPEVKKPKSPITKRGFKDATQVTRFIERWWAETPGALIGVPTGEKSGFWVLDIDLPGEEHTEDGRPWLAEMEGKHGKLTTRTATTATGGKHYYWKYADGVRNKAALAPGVDTRGEGGYTCMPGSVLPDGTFYEWDNDVPIVDAPDWLLDMVVKKKVEPTYAQPYDAGGLSPIGSTEIEELLGYISPDCGYGEWVGVLMAIHAEMGAGGLALADEWSSRGSKYRKGEVAQKWRGFKPNGGIGLGSLCELARQGGADLSAISRHHRPLAGDDTPIVDLGVLGGKRPLKAEVLVDVDPYHAEETLSDAVERVTALERAAPKPAFVITPYEWKDPKKLPRREFAFGTHYIRKYVSVTVSPGGVGKTSLSIVEGLSMVSGKDLTGIRPPSRLNVFLFNAEDPRDEMERRIQAACLHYRLKPEDINGHLFLDTGREQELVIAVEDKKTGTKIQVPIVEALVEHIRRYKIDVVIVDPFVSTHGVNENDNGAIDKVAKQWAKIADDTNCAVDIVHHLRKMKDDKESSVEDARGAVSLIGAARSVRVLNRMSEQQASDAGVSPGDRLSFFNIHQGKANLTKLSHAQDWRKLESVPLGNGTTWKPQDFAGVVTEWRWPGTEEIAAGVTPEQLRHIKTLLDNSDYKPAANAKNWAGQAVAYAVALDVDDAPQKRRATTILKALMKEGELVEVFGRDPISRKAAAFIRSNEHNREGVI